MVDSMWEDCGRDDKWEDMAQTSSQDLDHKMWN